MHVHEDIWAASQALAHRDIAFEKIIAQPQAELQALAEELGMSQQVSSLVSLGCIWCKEGASHG